MKRNITYAIVKKVVKSFTYIFIFIVILFIAINIYLSIPQLTRVYNSPYKNTVIKRYDLPEFLFFYNMYPKSYYKIYIHRKLIAKVDANCFECLEHNILNIRWYKDSVNVKYEIHYEKYDTINITYIYSDK